MKLRVLARVVVYDPEEKKVLLVKNKDMDFWYAPGGEWEYNNETIIEAANREVLEETGLNAVVQRFLYLQEFHATSDTIFFETFWLAEPSVNTEINDAHVDLDPNGQVEKAHWFLKEELQDKKIFPKRLKNTFWDRIERITQEEDPFLGID